jgi:hypothetical protein
LKYHRGISTFNREMHQVKTQEEFKVIESFDQGLETAAAESRKNPAAKTSSVP